MIGSIFCTKKVNMYNLLVTANEDAWEGTSYKFSRSRFLEYTVDDVAERFQVLDEDKIDILKSYPCLFAYEGTDTEVKIGKITAIRRHFGVLEIDYKFDEDIASVNFSDIERYKKDLDIRDWEMNRTHWAVKDADLYSILNKIFPEEISVPKERCPLPEIKNLEEVASVKEFIDKVFRFHDDTRKHEVFYRGHSQKYKLEPSLFRKDIDGNYLYLEKEDILYRELIISNSSDFSSDIYTLDRLVRMQHYSLPTRLLDISSNPLIALYFACKSSENTDGEVIFFRVQKDDIKYYDSDTASCLANLAKLSKAEQNKINTELDKQNKINTELDKLDKINPKRKQLHDAKHDFNDASVIKKLVHFIKEEKPFFKAEIEPSDLKKIICVKSKKSNERIASQSGAFLLFGIDSSLNEEGTESIKIHRVVIKDKSKILKELDLLNVNESSVFPYIENSAKYIAQKYKFQSN